MPQASLNKRGSISLTKNQRDHGSLFERVEHLEDAVGPALGSAGSLETLVAEGEARVKRQGDVAVDNLFTEEKHATEHLDEKTYAIEEKVSKKKWPKNLKNRAYKLKSKCKGPWKIGVWKALRT